MFKVSIIIPVYNAEKYLRNAVESAEDLPEVGEIILVEDSSPDNALAVCEELEEEYQKVKLYRHPNGENRGAGASRNLGLEKASCEFIAFLDADDWYLPNRFSETKEVFKDKSIDGVYEPVGTFFNDPEGEFLGKRMIKEKGDTVVTFPKINIKPGDLFCYLLNSNRGEFHTLGITLRQSLLKKVGKFSEHLKLHQDTEYWIRCAYYGELVASKKPVPVAKRRVHDNNRITGRSFKSRAMYYESLLKNLKGKPVSFKAKQLLFKKIITYNNKRRYQDTFLNKPERYLFILKYLPTFLFWNYLSSDK